MSSETEDRLREETKKWLERIKSEDWEGQDGENSEIFIDNIQAYTEDSEHFLEEGKLIEAFEAVIWAWSWLEIGQELDILE